jgi:hypothetical protein
MFLLTIVIQFENACFKRGRSSQRIENLVFFKQILAATHQWRE